MVTPLLTTKLYAPPTRPALVPRPHLVERLNAGLRQKLILVAAPAGFGKTTLLSEWLCRCVAPVAWFSVDEDDNDPARFLAYLSAALESLMPCEAPTAEEPVPAWDVAARDPETVLTTLINRLNTLSGDCVLVLDDYHLITAQPVHTMLTFLLNHLPRAVHLVVSSRADPPLPVARLRGRGQLTELRQADLRFTVDEAIEFLQRVAGLSLTADDAATLNARAEGWVAGLQMAAISMQGRDDAPGRVAGFIRALSGSNRYILDYLVEEVIERQPDDIQAFLFQTAILDRLSGSLCDAILYQETPERPAPRSQAILEYLDVANLFIVPLDDRREWYRYHRLFADLLRSRLLRLWPDRTPDLHRRAAAWYAAHGDIPEAIAHRLDVGDGEPAAALIEQVLEPMLMRGEIATLLHWLDALPEAVICAHPYMCAIHAGLMLLSGRPLETVEARLQIAERRRDEIPGQIAALRAVVAAYKVQAAAALSLARQALAQLPDTDRFLRSFALWIVSSYESLGGDLDHGDQRLDELARLSMNSGNVMIAVMAWSQLAESQARQGHLHQAWGLYQRALDLATDAQGQRLPIAGGALTGLSDIALLWGDLDTASGYVQEAITLTESWSEIAALEAYTALAWIRQMQGDVDAANAAIQQAQRIAIRFDATDFDDRAVACLQARLWLMQNNIAAAQRWAEERGLYPFGGMDLPPETDSQPEKRMIKYELVPLAHLLLALRQPAAALTVLDVALPIAARHRRPALMMQMHLLQAMALRSLGQPDRAMAALQETLALAEPEGYVSPFREMGAAALELLAEFHLWCERHPQGTEAPLCAYAGKLAALLGHPHAHSKPAVPYLHTAPSIPVLAEPLSARELEILHLLPSDLSAVEMAQTLFVSVHTVRSHLKTIYSKLDAHTRYEAIARAQALGLL